MREPIPDGVIDQACLPVLPDSGKREEMATGSVRDSRMGKGRFDLLPPRALRLVARHYEAGAVKYTDRNWELGQPLARMSDSAIRHIMSAMEGDMTEDHFVAAAWNLLCILEIRERIKLGILPASLDDLPGNPSGVRHIDEPKELRQIRDMLRDAHKFPPTGG